MTSWSQRSFLMPWRATHRPSGWMAKMPYTTVTGVYYCNGGCVCCNRCICCDRCMYCNKCAHCDRCVCCDRCVHCNVCMLWQVCILLCVYTVTGVYCCDRCVLLWPVCIVTGVYYHDNVCITVTSVYCDVYLRSVYYCTRCCACCQVSGPSHSHVLTVVLTELRPTVSWTNINRPSRIAIVHWA